MRGRRTCRAGRREHAPRTKPSSSLRTRSAEMRQRRCLCVLIACRVEGFDFESELRAKPATAQYAQGILGKAGGRGAHASRRTPPFRRSSKPPKGSKIPRSGWKASALTVKSRRARSSSMVPTNVTFRDGGRSDKRRLAEGGHLDGMRFALDRADGHRPVRGSVSCTRMESAFTGRFHSAPIGARRKIDVAARTVEQLIANEAADEPRLESRGLDGPFGRRG